MEGVGKFLLKSLKEMFLSSTETKLAAGLVKGDLGQMKKLLDPSEVGGTPFLGIQKPVIKPMAVPTPGPSKMRCCGPRSMRKAVSSRTFRPTSNTCGPARHGKKLISY